MKKIIKKIAKKLKPRKLNKKEIEKGRSVSYHEMSAEDQWAEDKSLGILDWDGN